MLEAARSSREQFLLAFNPSAQMQLCNDSKDCFFGNYPTLGALRKTWGDNTPVAWLVTQLYNLSEYCGCKEKLKGDALNECAYVIASEWGYLKVSEVMLFFHRFKSGRYGKFYGAVDPLTITTALREFQRERIYAYDQHDSELREKEREQWAIDAAIRREAEQAKRK